MAEFYERACEVLAQSGYHHYEISNWGKPGFESRHNLKYWKLESYVGFGADAHSFDGGVRWQNAESVEAYVSRVGQAKACPTSAERFFVGLRLTAGIRPTAEEWRAYDAPIRRFVDAGLLDASDGILRLTGRGVLLSNEVFQEFLT